MKRLILCILVMLCTVAVLQAKQMQPDPKRQAEIRHALIEHGYQAGKTWLETQEILRSIAREHHWQHTHAPDARVLILLGLGNKYSDPTVAGLPENHLDGEPDGNRP